MLSLVGLGLFDENDITLRALDTIRRADVVYCEFYTSVWHGNLAALEAKANKTIHVLTRSDVESDFLVDRARDGHVVLLVCGDPLSATTHFELLAACKKRAIPNHVVHAPSILTAVARTGLDVYKFGRITTLVFPTGEYSPTSPIDFIFQNKNAGLHTLVLLDVQSEHQRFMTIHDALTLLEQTAFGKKFAHTKLFACCQLGSPHQRIVYGTIDTLRSDASLTAVPAVLIVPGTMNHKETEYAELFA